MISRQYDSSAKIIALGNSGVGKTSLLFRYLRDTFEEHGSPNFNAEYFEKTMDTAHGKILLQFWDTAGQEQFRSVMRKYYRNALGAILVYDLVDADSFAALDRWLAEVKSNASEHLVAVLIGNKLDLKEKDPESARVVRSTAVSEFAAANGTRAFETSALSGAGVAEALNYLAGEMEKLVGAGLSNFGAPSVLPEDDPAFPEEGDQDSGGCC
jgi:small GTP-binding protein